MSVGARLAAGRDRVSRTDQTVVRGRFGQLSTKPMSRFRFAVPGGPWRSRGGNERGGSALFLEECWKDFPGPCILTLGGRYRGARLMSGGDPSGALRDIGTLFSSGMLGGLTDGQLLERFVNRDDSSAEDAFTILLERHGPMVWGVCRRLLSDRSAAADAFQATFLVLVRRARAVRVNDSLGPWLYGVSRRVAARARANSLRRRARETGGVETVAGRAPDPVRDERLAILDEEIGRLPERHRAAVVLCDLEGLPHEEAAPARLPGRDGREPPVPRAAAAARPPGAARAAPAAAALWAELAREASAAMPAAFIKNTARFVTSSPAAGTVPVAVTALAEGVIQMMWLARLKPLVAVAAALILATAGVAVQGRQQPAPEGAREQAKTASPPTAGAGAAPARTRRPTRPLPGSSSP